MFVGLLFWLSPLWGPLLFAENPPWLKEHYICLYRKPSGIRWVEILASDPDEALTKLGKGGILYCGTSWIVAEKIILKTIAKRIEEQN
jgi:hypothetical protein